MIYSHKRRQLSVKVAVKNNQMLRLRQADEHKKIMVMYVHSSLVPWVLYAILGLPVPTDEKKKGKKLKIITDTD